MSVVIRGATKDDRATCLDFIRSLRGMDAIDPAWEGVFDALMSRERGEVLVADEDGTLLGAATMTYNLAIRHGGEYAQIEELFVDPAARGKNVGGLLVTGLVDAARARGCPDIGLYLIARTTHNRPFYERYGFEVIGDDMRRVP